MSSVAAGQESRTAGILRQAIGPEFDYWESELVRPDRTLLLKLGGAIVDTELDVVAEAVQTLTELGVRTAIIHGAGPQINANLKAEGIPENFNEGIRVTDEETLTVVKKTLIDVNGLVTDSLRSRGVSAQPINEGVFTADFLDRDKYGLVGKVRSVNAQPILDALMDPSVAVINCYGSTDEGQEVNINADTAAGAVARERELGVYRFLTASDKGGVLDKHGNIIPVLNIRSGAIQQLIEDGTISDGMIPKVEEIATSVEGLPDDASASIAFPRNLIRELLTHAGEGTQIGKGDEIKHYSSISALDSKMVQQLIESAFKGGRLIGGYLDNLPETTEVFATVQQYNGIAIVLPHFGSDDPSKPAYLDKLAIRPESQGRGLGPELVQAVTAKYKNGVYWRTKTSNTHNVEFYSKMAQSHNTVNGWTVFTTGVKPEDQAECIERATHLASSVLY